MNFKFDKKLNPFWHQNGSKFHRKSIKQLHPPQSWFWDNLLAFVSSISNQFWTTFGSRLAGVFDADLGLEAFPTSNWTPRGVWTAFEAVQGALWKSFWSDSGSKIIRNPWHFILNQCWPCLFFSWLVHLFKVFGADEVALIRVRQHLLPILICLHSVPSHFKQQTSSNEQCTKWKTFITRAQDRFRRS